MSLSRYIQERYDCGNNDTRNSSRRLRYALPKSLVPQNGRAGMIAICQHRDRSCLQAQLAREPIDADLDANATLNVEDNINLSAAFEPYTDDKITSVNLTTRTVGACS